MGQECIYSEESRSSALQEQSQISGSTTASQLPPWGLPAATSELTAQNSARAVWEG